MKTEKIIKLASLFLAELPGHEFDVLEVAKPVSPEAALNLAKIISKLSPLVGNLIEFNTCEYLNDQEAFKKLGRWIRQDPGFPDTVFIGDVTPVPGFEIKAWFPLATEITARFKDSQSHFLLNNTYVALMAWLPKNLIFGRPTIIDVEVIAAATIAKARDKHYHHPPSYVVLEPGDTSLRPVNLQQTNTNGLRFQGDAKLLAEAEAMVASWGADGTSYRTDVEYQTKLQQLIYKFPYRLDTNFAKMDRIQHSEIEAFKLRVGQTRFHGRTISEWNRLLSSSYDQVIEDALNQTFDVRDTGRDVVKEDASEQSRGDG